ncbi:MAG: tetratricopeptide repeat protein, partial [bacterium]|nr:tetratricopeptide repeat protein [bacterium]
MTHLPQKNSIIGVIIFISLVIMALPTIQAVDTLSVVLVFESSAQPTFSENYQTQFHQQLEKTFVGKPQFQLQLRWMLNNDQKNPNSIDRVPAPLIRPVYYVKDDTKRPLLNPESVIGAQLYPIVIINEHKKPSLSISLDIDPLAGRICQPNSFVIPPIQAYEDSILRLHLSAFLDYSDQNYAGAIEKFKKLRTSAADFFLGMSYLKRQINRPHLAPARKSDLDSAAAFFAASLKDSSAFNSVYALNNLGVAHQISGRLDSARYYFEKANTRLNQTENPDDRIVVTRNLGNIYLLNGSWNAALEVFHAAIRDMESTNDAVNLALTCENLGNIYQLILQHNKATEFHQRALEIRRSLSDDTGMALSFRQLGIIYSEQKDFQKAIDYYSRGLLIFQELENNTGIAAMCDRLGQAYQRLGVSDSASAYFENSIRIYQQLDNYSALMQTLQHQALFYQQQKQFDQATGHGCPGRLYCLHRSPDCG